MRKYLPLIVGLFLGAVSIIMGKIPTAVAQFSGMTVIGNHIGYLLCALTMAWIYCKSWRNSFIAGLLTMTAANLTYYVSILAFYLFDIGYPPTPMNTLLSFMQWTVISAIICVLAATAVWIAQHSKSHWLNYGIFIVSYFGLLGVIYLYQVRFFINWYSITFARDGFVQTWRFAGYLYEIGFSFVITTIILSIGLRVVIKKKTTTS